MRLVQSVATGIELIELGGVAERRRDLQRVRPRDRDRRIRRDGDAGLDHRFLEIYGEFRERCSWAPSWVQSGTPHGEVRGSTLGIVGYGRVGREVARRPAPFGCRVLAANRSPREPRAGVERIYPLAELDRMLPECDTVAICTALGPETDGADRRPRGWR